MATHHGQDTCLRDGGEEPGNRRQVFLIAPQTFVANPCHVSDGDLEVLSERCPLRCRLPAELEPAFDQVAEIRTFLVLHAFALFGNPGVDIALAW